MVVQNLWKNTIFIWFYQQWIWFSSGRISFFGVWLMYTIVRQLCKHSEKDLLMHTALCRRLTAWCLQRNEHIEEHLDVMGCNLHLNLRYYNLQGPFWFIYLLLPILWEAACFGSVPAVKTDTCCWLCCSGEGVAWGEPRSCPFHPIGYDENIRRCLDPMSGQPQEAENQLLLSCLDNGKSHSLA